MATRRRIVMQEGNSSILGIIGGGYGELLAEILKVMDRYSNRFYSNKENRARIMAKLDLQEMTYHRRLRWLLDKQILIKVKDSGRGVYSVNRKVLNFI